VINETINCPIDCTYCILQGYINNPAITIYTNYQKIIEEIQTLSRLNRERILRIGTGELTDSLALDPITRLSEKLIPEVQKLPNILLELKSKTDHIDHLSIRSSIYPDGKNTISDSSTRFLKKSIPTGLPGLVWVACVTRRI